MLNIETLLGFEGSADRTPWREYEHKVKSFHSPS